MGTAPSSCQFPRTPGGNESAGALAEAAAETLAEAAVEALAEPAAEFFSLRSCADWECVPLQWWRGLDGA